MYFLKEKINSKLLKAIITLSNGKEITVSKLIELYNDRWITVHPPKGDKSDKGVPVQIDEEGTIQKGLGGKHTGKKISQIRKTSKQEPSKEPTKEPKKETSPASENPYDTEEKRKKIEQDYKSMVAKSRDLDYEEEKYKDKLLDENARYKQLRSKRFAEGLSDDEMKELLTIKREAEEKAEREYDKRKDQMAWEVAKVEEEYHKALEYEEKEKKSKAKEIARENYHPKSIAGVAKGKDMSFAEADNGHVNPNYKKPNEEGYESGYAQNCQACVVCLEMRRRGYNVKTKKYVYGGFFTELGRHCSSAWLDKETGDIAVTTKLKAKNVKDLYSQLDNTMKEGERYNLEFWWKGSESGHIVSMYKENGKVVWYDPQTNITYKDEALLEKLGTVSIRRQVEILRIDDKSFNPYYIDKIVEKNS